MPCCVVPTCKNASGALKKEDGITFHRFPRDEVRKYDWSNIIRRARLDELWKPTRATVVCSTHFDEELFYVTKCGLKRLKKEAIPNKRLALAAENHYSHYRRLKSKNGATLPHQSPSSSPVHNEKADVEISDTDSMFDSPEEMELKTQLRRREKFCKLHVRRIKALQRKIRRIENRNKYLKQMVVNVCRRKNDNNMNK